MSALEHARWPQTLVDLVEVQACALRQLKLPPTVETYRIAQAMVKSIAHYLGGRHIYIPVGRSLDRALRDAEIFRVAHRNNKADIAKRYGLTVRAVEMILKQQGELHRAHLPESRS